MIRPPRVSKLRLVELSRKKQRIALDEYSGLVVRFLVLGQYMTQFWGSKSNFREIGNFQLCSSKFEKL